MTGALTMMETTKKRSMNVLPVKFIRANGKAAKAANRSTSRTVATVDTTLFISALENLA